MNSRKTFDTLNVRWLRRKLGMTQIDLAEKLNVDQTTVSRWERGIEEPRPASYMALRDLLVAFDDRRVIQRQLAVIQNDLVIGGLADDKMRIWHFSERDREHNIKHFNVDLKSHLGWELARHAAYSGRSELWERMTKAGVGGEDLLLLRTEVHYADTTHVNHWEPCYEDGRIFAWQTALVEKIAAPSPQNLGLIGMSAIYADSPMELTEIHRAEA
ncbi:DNA-binding transcriptional regulator [Celeribacter sp. PS-C1]|uniref:helix-turn-helix domain-containing protein n=1 Tax=Celeribacter sp. PS-C1 TaxID=2820813 RepID=UPI002105FBB1|nr:helix-turn-helix transcriptional regulator [Celeribacter sp. PS-C1]